MGPRKDESPIEFGRKGLPPEGMPGSPSVKKSEKDSSPADKSGSDVMSLPKSGSSKKLPPQYNE